MQTVSPGTFLLDAWDRNGKDSKSTEQSNISDKYDTD